METSNNTGKVIGALLLGALVGATLGILFAPDKGNRTRRKLLIGAQDMAEDITDKIKEEAEALRKKAMELEELAEEKLKEMTKSFRQNVDATNNGNHYHTRTTKEAAKDE
jgi:gas vesicle protein